MLERELEELDEKEWSVVKFSLESIAGSLLHHFPNLLRFFGASSEG